jgi:hypothetical protein
MLIIDKVLKQYGQALEKIEKSNFAQIDCFTAKLKFRDQNASVHLKR